MLTWFADDSLTVYLPGLHKVKQLPPSQGS
jgi:hypothetical protein